VDTDKERDMTFTRPRKVALGWLGPLALVVLGVQPAYADAVSEKRARCATRLSVALLGKSPDAALMGAANPQDQVDALIARPEFVERFARFTNATFNDERGATAAAEAPYFLAREILSTNKPWRDLFVGQYNVDVPAGGGAPVVTADPNGLGYFRSVPWLRRYAGNEAAGLKLVTAYRMLNNVIGAKMVANTNAVGVDTSAAGREAAACAGCHYQGPFALDLVARILTRRQGTGNNMTFVASTSPPQAVLDGTIANDAELVQRMVDSDSFKFRTCRLAFQFLQGRAENQCESVAFDACVDAFDAAGTMQAAIASVAKNPNFCQ
jgi:hypothetical protein